MVEDSSVEMFGDEPELIQIFEQNSKLVRNYLKKMPNFQQLCQEVSYTLDKSLKKNNIEFSTISHRVKSLESFAEKNIRKIYKNPIEEMTDIAGVRVVYLYKNDFSKIEKIINSEFEVVDKVDKRVEQGEEKFGYSAVHFLVRLGKKSSGARYDDLKDYICEIQVRTVLQDAWAIIDHHLIYKQEEDIPSEFRRKLNSLSGLFETADDHFEKIRAERNAYLKKINKTIGRRSVFLNQEINLDTLNAYLKWRFPDKVTTYFGDSGLGYYVKGLKSKYQRLNDLEKLLERTGKEREAICKKFRPERTAAGELRKAVLLENPNSKVWGATRGMRSVYRKYSNLVKHEKTNNKDKK